MTSEQLFYDKKTGFDRLTDEDKQGIQTYAEGYKKFLDESKTERDAVLEIARMAESKGFRAWTRDDTLRPGDKIYRINRYFDRILLAIKKGYASLVAKGRDENNENCTVTSEEDAPYKATISDKEKDDLEYFSIKAENELGKLLKSKQSEDDDDEEEN